MITSARNKHDQLIREFTHRSSGVTVKRIGGVLESEYTCSYEHFNKVFLDGNSWEVLIEQKAPVIVAKEKCSGFEGELVVTSKATKKKQISQPILL